MNQKQFSRALKAVVVIMAFVAFFLFSHIAFIETAKGDIHSVFGFLANLVTPDGSIWNKIVKYMLCAVIPIFTILIVCRGRNVWECWGVRDGFLKGWCVGLICVLPMLACNSLAGCSEFSWEYLLLGAILPGLFEELLFRGFLFGLLFRFCRWGLVWAALPPAVVFTIGHFYQAHDLLSGLQVFTVTALGSLFFSWLYAEWGTLWVSIAFHILMNAIWQQIPVDGVTSSIGNVATNIGRVATIILAIVLTFLYKKKQGKNLFDYKII